MSHYLAFDFGAESGRALLGSLAGGKLAVEELHRFPNTPVRILGALFWDTLRLWHEIQHGIAVAVRDRKLVPDGIGIDTWGVDCALIGADGQLCANPRHYRDPRNAEAMEKTFAVVPRDQVFGYTGIQFMQINTLFQLYADKLNGSPALGRATRMLHIPDLFNYWLTGEARSEVTIASTSQFFNPATMTWATELFERLGLPAGILCPVVTPGTLLGKTLEAPHIPVYASAGHDTAAAVAAVPSQGGDDWCYITSGTWSLMGLELDAPIINAASLAANYTNEVGVAGKVRLLKNIAGLWLLQECRRQWMEEGAEYSYEQLANMAAAARPFSAAVNPDAFLEPGGMPDKIAAHCSATGQSAPADARGVRPRHPGEPGAALPQRAGEPGSALGQAYRGDPHRGRRIEEHAAQPVRGRLHRAARDRRSGRSDRHRQHPGAGVGRGRIAGAGGDAAGGAEFLRAGHGGAASKRGLGAGVRALPEAPQVVPATRACTCCAKARLKAPRVLLLTCRNTACEDRSSPQAEPWFQGRRARQSVLPHRAVKEAGRVPVWGG